MKTVENINVKKTALHLLFFASVLGLPGNSINFSGRKYELKDGTIALLFTCSSELRPNITYAEFLVNGKSTASAIYVPKKNKCVFRQAEEECTELCLCSSDGKTFTWTFPKPSSMKMVHFSCHMFVGNTFSKDQAHIMYNGTDFTLNTPDNDVVSPSIKTTTTYTTNDQDEEQEGNNSTEASVNFIGRKYKMKDGRTVLLFTCSSAGTTDLSHAEFLVNGKSTAISIYNAKTDQCNFMQSDKDCTDVCACFSNGKTFNWTFPVQSSKEIMRFSCHMFIKSKFSKDQAEIIFNGRDFTFNVPDYDVVTSTIETTIKDVKIHNNDDELEDDASNALFVVGVVIISLVVIVILCMLCYLWYKNRKNDQPHNQTGTLRTSCKPKGIQIRTSEYDDHEEHFLIQRQNNTAIDQIPRVNIKTEEQNLVKLNRLITKVGMKLMRAYFRKQVLQDKHLVSFLETNKHLMFHAMHPKRRCCQCLREKLDINHLGVLLKQHFYQLYSKEIEPCDFSCQTQCICIYTPQKKVVLDTLDLSTLIGIASAVSTGTSTLQNLIQVQTFCKEIIPFIGTCSVPNNEFKIIWEKIKTFFLTLAQNDDFSTGDLHVTGDEMQSLYEEKIEKTTDEFAEVLLQWKNFDELSNQESDEKRFQVAAKCFGQFTSNRMKLCKLNHLEVYFPDLANDIMKKNYMKDKIIQRVLVRIGIPHSWDLDRIVSTFIEVTKTCSIQISEKTLDGRDFMFVANINKGLDDKTSLETELLNIVKETVCVNGMDSSSQDKMQIDIALSKDLAGELSIPTLIGREPVKMYLQRGGPRYINSFALLSDNEVVFTEVYNKALVIYNFKTQVRHNHDLPGIPFDMIVLTKDQFAVTFSDLMGIYQYSISDSKLILINNYKKNEQCLSIGKRDESSLYVFIENKGLFVLNLLDQPSATFESMLSGFDPRHDSITFSDIYIYYTNRSTNSVYCYDIEERNIRILDGTFNNPSSIANLQDCVFVSVNDNSGAVYVKRVDGLFHQVILTKADGLECSNIIHFYEDMSCLMFVNRETGFAAIHKLPCFGAQVALSGKSKTTCS